MKKILHAIFAVPIAAAAFTGCGAHDDHDQAAAIETSQAAMPSVDMGNAGDAAKVTAASEVVAAYMNEVTKANADESYAQWQAVSDVIMSNADLSKIVVEDQIRTYLDQAPTEQLAAMREQLQGVYASEHYFDTSNMSDASYVDFIYHVTQWETHANALMRTEGAVGFSAPETISGEDTQISDGSVTFYGFTGEMLVGDGSERVTPPQQPVSHYVSLSEVDGKWLFNAEYFNRSVVESRMAGGLNDWSYGHA